MAVRASRFAAVAALVALALTGCDSGLFSGALAVRMNGRVLEFAICRSADITSLRVQERGTGIFRQWTEVVAGSGSATVISGTTFSERNPLSGLEIEKLGQFELREGHELAVTLRGGSSGALLDAVFVIGGNGLPSDGWLQPDGSVTEESCPS